MVELLDCMMGYHWAGKRDNSSVLQKDLWKEQMLVVQKVARMAFRSVLMKDSWLVER